MKIWILASKLASHTTSKAMAAHQLLLTRGAMGAIAIDKDVTGWGSEAYGAIWIQSVRGILPCFFVNGVQVDGYVKSHYA